MKYLENIVCHKKTISLMGDLEYIFHHQNPPAKRIKKVTNSDEKAPTMSQLLPLDETIQRAPLISSSYPLGSTLL